ncbi:ImpA family type VI secretion system protein [Burkholderia metallica]|uniref:type VI secretion system protein TssA n=1 Tax=Burkholderia metallica TaxID=488729 RepID=UPI001452F771|nr:type VI secretion system ImpA family N-terminal domain-containing protein [Burkholderia metallica]VWB15856.1 type VI secretion protein ImpA [Burkholderia metallica]
MSKKQSAAPGKPARTSAANVPNFDWLTPVSDDLLCGPDLEYDHDFVVLFSRVAPKQDVQYGAFVGAPDPLNWSEIERDCRRLMMRTKDLRVAVLYTRCRVRLGGVVGLAEGTAVLAAWVQAFPDDIHPQTSTDNDRDAALEMRMNALQALSDAEGLLADVREIVLVKSTVTRLQVRDVERAFAHPRPADALAPESVIQQLQDLRTQHPATIEGIDDTIAHLATINAWCNSHLESHQPDLSMLTRLLDRLGTPTQAESAEPPDTIPAPTAMPDTSSQDNAVMLTAPANSVSASDPECASAPNKSMPSDRDSALATIRAARAWFEHHEPSSPIPVLLKRAEQFVGKRYAEVVKAIPAELLAQWEDDGS